MPIKSAMDVVVILYFIISKIHVTHLWVRFIPGVLNGLASQNVFPHSLQSIPFHAERVSRGKAQFIPPQSLDLLLWFYVYLSAFSLLCSHVHHLTLYQVSIRRLVRFATPFPPPVALPHPACGSLHLAVSTRDRTFTG